jgi:hypothetical protein
VNINPMHDPTLNRIISAINDEFATSLLTISGLTPEYGIGIIEIRHAGVIQLDHMFETDSYKRTYEVARSFARGIARKS